MSNLVAYVNDGIEIYVDNETGESFASIRGYARMSGVANQRISERLSSARFSNAKYAEVLTVQGLRTARLIPEDAIVEWLPKDNPTLAVKLMKLGVRKFMHTVAGYEPPKQEQKPVTQAELSLLLAQSLVSLEKQVLAQGEAIDEIRSHTIGHEGFYTLAAFVNKHNINMSSRDWKQTGKRLTAMSNKLGKQIKQIPDVKYGCINAYDECVLRSWFVGEC